MNDKAKEILSWMSDDISRDIYTNRILFMDTFDYKYIQDTIDKYRPEFKREKWFELSNEFKARINKYDHVIVAGAGDRGKILTKALKDAGYTIMFIVDNRATGDFLDIPITKPHCISSDKLLNTGVIISLSDRSISEQIKNQLIELKYPKNQICLLSDYVAEAKELHQLQYFDDESIISYGDKETFVDCGVLDFETSSVFIDRCREHKVKSISVIAFEPDPQNYDVCKKEIKKDIYKDVNIDLFDMGVWSDVREIGFSFSGNGNAKVVENGTQKIKVVSLDSVIDVPVTFIKMDIEGAELEALKGAHDTIRKYRPKLAISIYHKREDVYDIPKYIKSIVPEYRLYLRHYSNNTGELVLFAI